MTEPDIRLRPRAGGWSWWFEYPDGDRSEEFGLYRTAKAAIEAAQSGEAPDLAMALGPPDNGTRQ